jgi:hypothetical protein
MMKRLPNGCEERSTKMAYHVSFAAVFFGELRLSFDLVEKGGW